MYAALTRKIQQFVPDSATRRFMDHNREVWSRRPDADGEVLLEVNALHSATISYAYVAEVLSRQFGGRVKGYTAGRVPIGSGVVEPMINRVYRSFGTTEIFCVQATPEQEKRVAALSHELLPGFRTKEDVEDFHVEDVWIGDLLYDEHLRSLSVPTVTVGSDAFAATFLETLKQFVFWSDYLDAHDVRAVNVSHSVYNYAILPRLCLARGIPTFQVNAGNAYRMSSSDMWAYNDFFYFRKEFAKLPEDQQASARAAAKERLELRFSGRTGVDMPYSTKSAYGKVGDGRVIEASGRPKILVALHCFFDSPHTYGKPLFPDFYEWLEFLGDISTRTDYDWYLKSHPDFLPGNAEIVEAFRDRFDRFTVIPATTSHHQIIGEGIDVALTVYGSIGLEYAALGIPVINASTCNPHIEYPFNVHPKSRSEYEAVLLDLANLDLAIELEDVYEYYYMRHLNSRKNWLFADYDAFVDSVGGYYGQFTSAAYAAYLSTFSDDQHNRALESLSRFVASGEYSLKDRHLSSTEAVR